MKISTKQRDIILQQVGKSKSCKRRNDREGDRESQTTKTYVLAS